MNEFEMEGGGVAAAARELSAAMLNAYRERPELVEEHANIEETIAEADYGGKQVFEFVQNAADALLGGSGRVHVLLADETLYVANGGAPLTRAGVEALLGSHLSRKTGDEIGRFGLGFKSVVGISDAPRFLSRSGSFGFDRAWSREQISGIVPDAPGYPVLRLARPVDAAADIRADKALAELAAWATTVLVVPLKGGSKDIAYALEKFPSEFVLFSPHVTELIVEDRRAGLRRSVVTERARDGLITVDSNGTKSHWRVRTVRHIPSAEAAADAGARAERPSIDVSWAAPMDSGRAQTGVGTFWAYFPTDDQTTLSGIINAPWHLTSNRRQLVPGPFNEEILTSVVPAIIAAEWPHLVRDDDPTAHFDLLPARGREERSWADDVLNEPIFAALRKAPSVPATDGRLCRPASLQIHSKELPEKALEYWSSLKPGPTGWVHHGVDATDARRLKVDRLMPSTEHNRPPVNEWIEALCRPPTVEASAVAIAVLDAVVSERSSLAKEARSARVVLLEDGKLAAAEPGRIFVRSSPKDDSYRFIHPELAQLPATRRALQRLGVSVLDRAGELRHLLKGKRSDQVDWAAAWGLIRSCDIDVVKEIFASELGQPFELHVQARTRSGMFVRLGLAYLPGAIVSDSTPEDATVCFDTSYHREDLEKLDALGAVSQPTLRGTAPKEPWASEYESAIRKAFREKAKGSKPQLELLEVQHELVPWPLQPIEALSPHARVALTGLALSLADNRGWFVSHSTNKAFGREAYPNGVYWLIGRFGRFETPLGPTAPADCILPFDGLTELDQKVLPLVDVSSDVAKRLNITADLSRVSAAAWRRFLEHALGWDDLQRITRLLCWAVHFADAPESVRAQVGRHLQAVQTSDVAVATDDETFRSLTEQGIPVVLVSGYDDAGVDAEALVDRWGLEVGKRLLEQQLVPLPAGEPEMLVDRFPKLRLYDIDPNVQLQICSALEITTATRDGQKTRSLQHAIEAGVVYVTSADPARILTSVSTVLQLDLSGEEIRSILDQARAQEVEALLARVRNCSNDDERLAELLGNDRLRRSVPSGAIRAIEGRLERELTGLELASLVRSVHGVGTLQHFKRDLEDLGLDVPLSWAGKSPARRFVADLGFSADYAGFSVEHRPAAFGVDGPAVLPPLHDYQAFVVDRIKGLLHGDGPARGMVSLPTGAGKTRVAVQALIEEITAGTVAGPIVWVAQSDELCEQAVEAWSYTWRACGPADRMTISRLWGTNEVEEVTEGFHLIVAIIDKLEAIRNRADSRYGWLTEPSVVVVDEAHTSIAPTYTRVLDWLGRGQSRKTRRPLLGLTATPFRGTSSDETQRLVNRYDQNRLDLGAFERDDPYVVLQERQVLARVDHRQLDGVDVELTSAEAREVEQLRRLPASVETQLGGNQERNLRIVESIKQLPRNWTILLFATSVENATVLAALLTYEGIPSIAISGGTDRRERRHYVEEFKAGRIRVITNFAVLAQGFDAPNVQAVYVTRPTFSPNTYQQMIGRGLRGPKNGGSAEVLIVDVADNFSQFGELLSFREFEPLWTPSRG